MSDSDKSLSLSPCQFCGDTSFPSPWVTRTLTPSEVEGVIYFDRKCSLFNNSSLPSSPTFSPGDPLTSCPSCWEPFAQLCALLGEVLKLQGKLDQVTGQLEERTRAFRSRLLEEVEIKTEEVSDFDGFEAEEEPFVKIEIDPDPDPAANSNEEEEEISASFDLQQEEEEDVGIDPLILINPEDVKSEEEDSPSKIRGTGRRKRKGAAANAKDEIPPKKPKRRKSMKKTKTASATETTTALSTAKSATATTAKRPQRVKGGQQGSTLTAAGQVEADEYLSLSSSEESTSEEDYDPTFGEEDPTEKEEPPPKPVSNDATIEYKRRCIEYIDAHPKHKFTTLRKQFSLLRHPTYMRLWRRQIEADEQKKLEKERKKDEPPPVFPCPDCGFVFKKNYKLNHHRRNVHLGECNQVCDICGKVLKKSFFQRHMNIHLGIKPHQCSYCGKTFSLKPSLEQHIRIHTGETKYDCSLCDRKFIQKSGLKAHLISHERKGDKVQITNKERDEQEEAVYMEWRSMIERL